MAATSNLDLGQLIYDMRAENGLSQRELAEWMEITRSATQSRLRDTCPRVVDSNPCRAPAAVNVRLLKATHRLQPNRKQGGASGNSGEVATLRIPCQSKANSQNP